MEFPLSQAVVSSNAFEHRPAEDVGSDPYETDMAAREPETSQLMS